MEPSDVVQETLLLAHRDRASFRGSSEGERAKWLRQILLNVVLQTARKLRAQKRGDNREISLEALTERTSRQLEACLAASAPSPVEGIIREEQVLALADALATLSEDQRRVILLHHSEGMTLHDIGAELDRTRASVAGLLRRGLKILRERLSGESTP